VPGGTERFISTLAAALDPPDQHDSLDRSTSGVSVASSSGSKSENESGTEEYSRDDADASEKWRKFLRVVEVGIRAIGSSVAPSATQEP